MRKPKRKTRPKGSAYWHGQSWWIAFSVTQDGQRQRVRENTRLTDPEARREAETLLVQRLAEATLNSSAPKREGVAFEDLAQMLVNDYRKAERKSLDRAERAIFHLSRAFAGEKAENIDRARVDAYIAERLTAKPKPAARATVQKEVAALGRMFTLAIELGRLKTRPHFAGLDVHNTRTESFSPDELARLLDVLEHGRPQTAMSKAIEPRPDLAAPIAFAAMTGWRTSSDVLTLRWRQVDFEAGTVTRPGRGTSKAHEAIVFPFTALPELTALLARQRQVTDALQRERGCIIDRVFHLRDGRQIKEFRAAWTAACAAAGTPGRVLHDLRRTGARRLRAIGMSDRDIAELCGWGTIAMVSRYLGRDPSGVADRLRLKVQEAGVREAVQFVHNSATAR